MTLVEANLGEEYIVKEGDTLVVTKLDRLARNTIEGIQIVENLFDRGVCLPSDTNMSDEDLERVIDLVKCCFVKEEITC